MPNLVPLVAVTIVRNGAKVRPTPGKPFNFTPAEAKEISDSYPRAFRDPVNETVAALPAAPVADAKADTKAKTTAKAKTDDTAADDTL